METHISRQYTLAEIEPGWPEDMAIKRTKASPRTQGSMRMSLRRVSRTPENSRAYAHGDPVSLIDWKAFGRTDELVIREHRDEASARVLLVFDLGQTLKWPTKSDVEFHGGISQAIAKSELAIRILLYFAHAHLTFGDSVTIACIDGGQSSQKSWSPKGPAEILRVHETCIQQGFSEGLMSFMGESDQGQRRFDIAWLMSDFLGEGFLNDYLQTTTLGSSPAPNLTAQISKIIDAKDLRVLHIFSWLETISDWMDGATSYRDEGGDHKVYLGDQLKQAGVWAGEIAQWRKTVESSVSALGGVYLAVDDRMKVADLFHWLANEAVTR